MSTRQISNPNRIAAKFDHVTDIRTGDIWVVAGHFEHNSGPLFDLISLTSSGRTAVLFADEIRLVRRAEQNRHHDEELTELAQIKNHAFRQMRLELAGKA